MDGIERSLFVSRIQAICQEMGAVLQHTAFSPNIRDRLDFSCAVFDAAGRLCAQAAHIPVHLGSMAYAMRDIVSRFEWRPGDTLILNDPYLGGTHLPDVTLVSPVFAAGRCVGFLANRAHHADIGSATPGSMPVARSLDEEGHIITPTWLARDGLVVMECWEDILSHLRSPAIGHADLSAQYSTNVRGVGLLDDLVTTMGRGPYLAALDELNDYGAQLALSAISKLGRGRYRFEDLMDDDGAGHYDIPIRLLLDISADAVRVDFSGSAGQVEGNINCPLSVTAAAVYYCFYCLMPMETPACGGAFSQLHIIAPPGSLLNAKHPAAVAAGNVETSSRLVDCMLGALAQANPGRIPAASQGTMNNVAMGAAGWDYYETIGGGMGAGPRADGCSAVQSHMTNTLNTPIEILEMHYPLRVERYQVRSGSGGAGNRRGGDGLIREFRLLGPAQVSLLTERRRHAPWGLQGGATGLPGRNLLNGRELPAKTHLLVADGEILTIETPGGGGYGTIPPGA